MSDEAVLILGLGIMGILLQLLAVWITNEHIENQSNKLNSRLDKLEKEKTK